MIDRWIITLNFECQFTRFSDPRVIGKSLNAACDYGFIETERISDVFTGA
jgi:hypothetical protein